MCEWCGFMIRYLMWLGKLLSSYCVRVLALLIRKQLFVKPEFEIRVPFRRTNVMIPGSSHCQDRPVAQLSGVAAQPPFQSMSLSEKATISQRSAHWRLVLGLSAAMF